MAIKISGTTVINDDRDITNIIDMTVTGNVTFSSTGAIQIPSGNTAQQPSGVGGMIRYNNEDNKIEYYNADASSWRIVGSSSAALSADNLFIASTY